MERPPFLQNLEYGKLYVFYGQNNRPLYHVVYRDITQGSDNHFLDMPIVMTERDDILDTKVYIAARRFNVGNVGKDAVTWTCIDVTQPTVDMALALLKMHISHIDDDTSGDDVLGDAWLTPEPAEEMAQHAVENSAPEPAQPLGEVKPNILPRAINIQKKKNIFSYFKRLDKHEDEREDLKLEMREQRRQQDLASLQAIILRFVTTYHQDPSELIGKWIKGKYILNPGEENLSRLVVNKNLKIVLSDWNEKVLPLHALARTLYILFLLHPEGIVLKDIGDYRQELLEIYNIVKPGRDEELALRAIDSLTSPFSDTLSQNLSRIKRAVKTIILDDDTARHYYIDGRRGQPYRIALPRHLVTLPAIFKP